MHGFTTTHETDAVRQGPRGHIARKSVALLTGAAALLLGSTSVSAKSNIDDTLGTEANPATSCADLHQDGNFWIKAPARVRTDALATDRVYTTCTKDGFQLISQFVDTAGDDLTISQLSRLAAEYGWTTGPDGATMPSRTAGIGRLTTDMLTTSGSFGLGTDVVGWKQAAGLDSTDHVQVCFFEVKERKQLKAGKERCADVPMRQNLGRTGEFPFSPPRLGRGQRTSVVTSGEAIATMASWSAAVTTTRWGTGTVPYANDTNCWQVDADKRFGSAGKTCEVALPLTDPTLVEDLVAAGSSGCAWVGLNEADDDKTERFCFDPSGVSDNELIRISSKKDKDVMYGFRIYAQFTPAD